MRRQVSPSHACRWRALRRRRMLASPLAAIAADHPLGAPVAQVLDTYVIAVAADGGLVLVDQHAAHERLTHEAAAYPDGCGRRAQPAFAAAVGGPNWPRRTPRVCWRGRRSGRRSASRSRRSAGAAVLVRALPAALGAVDPAPLLRDLADELAELDEATALAARLDAVLARMACHGSIRAGRRLGRRRDGRAAASRWKPPRVPRHAATAAPRC